MNAPKENIALRQLTEAIPEPIKAPARKGPPVPLGDRKSVV